MRTELGVTKIQEFLKHKSLTTDFAETRRVDNLICKIVFLTFLTPSVPSGRKLGARNFGVIQHSSKIFSFDFDETWQNDVGSLRMETF